ARSSQSSNIELSSLSMVAKVRGCGGQRWPADPQAAHRRPALLSHSLVRPERRTDRPGRDPPSKHDQFMTEVKFYHSSQSKEVHHQSSERSPYFIKRHSDWRHANVDRMDMRRILRVGKNGGGTCCVVSLFRGSRTGPRR